MEFGLVHSYYFIDINLYSLLKFTLPYAKRILRIAALAHRGLLWPEGNLWCFDLQCTKLYARYIEISSKFFFSGYQQKSQIIFPNIKPFGVFHHFLNNLNILIEKALNTQKNVKSQSRLWTWNPDWFSYIIFYMPHSLLMTS